MLQKVELFGSKKDYFYFFLISLFIFFLSLSYEYYKYKELTKFNSALLNVSVLKQYTKSKLTKKGRTKTYQVLKLKAADGFTFYTTGSKKLRDLTLKKIEVEAWAGDISFYEYMSQFFAFTKILHINEDISYKESLNTFIDKQHENKDISAIYQALFTAKQVSKDLQTLFSNLGISHLIAISGFHLGVLSALLFFLLKYPYKFFQNRYFPYRSYTLDSFIIISVTLLAYLLFLDSPPSLLRAFVMLVLGFFLYDRGIKIISLQTLSLTVILILAFFPRLLFSIGFWLSVAGVFNIFLFLIHFKSLNKYLQFVFIPLWTYLVMLPYSLVLFGNFSIYHGLSIIWSLLFTLFYPLSMLLHLFGFGNLLDFSLEYLLSLQTACNSTEFDMKFLVAEILLSALAIYKKVFVYVLLLYSLAIFIYLVQSHLSGV